MIKNTQKAKLNKRGIMFVNAITLIITIIIVLLTAYLLNFKIVTTVEGEEISFRNEINKMITN